MYNMYHALIPGNGNGTNGSNSELNVNALRHHNGSFIPQTNNGK